MITKERRMEIVKKFGKSPTDTGSSAVQVALVTERIEDLRPHFEKHKLDHHSNRGLLKLIGQRRRLLRNLQATSETEYAKVIKELGLRK